MMASAMAIRGYTSREISPLIRAQMETRFLPHSVPSYAAQTNIRALTEKFPDYTYKEAALNPTNPSDRATVWAADITRAFRNDAGRKSGRAHVSTAVTNAHTVWPHRL